VIAHRVSGNPRIDLGVFSMTLLRGGTHGTVIRLVLAASLLLVVSPARALINPNYTPVELVNQTTSILRLQVKAGDAGQIKIDGQRLLAGKTPPAIALEVDRTNPTAVKLLREALGDTTKPALLFLGDFSDAVADQPPPGTDSPPVGLLHVDLTWFALKRAGDKLLLEDDKLRMQTVWAGSNDMLEKVVDYVLNDYRADLPVKVGVRWAGDRKLADLPGKVHACLAVELRQPGRPCLLVLSDSGDRLFRVGEGGEFDDVTEEMGLATKSRTAVCGDFNGDGRMDLACSDAGPINALLAEPTGRFSTHPIDVELSGACFGLTAIGRGSGQTALLVSTLPAPVVLTSTGDGKWHATPLERPVAAPASARPCLAADFDGDGLCDVVWLHAGGALIYKGQTEGFAAPTVACDRPLGENTGAPFTGDFDADGLLDIVVPRPSCCSLLINLGNGRFRDALREAGEVDYNSAQSETIGGSWCDLNNDGRQDFVLFSPNVGYQPYFNRGFRCFGYAPQIDTERTKLSAAAAAKAGQQAGVVADFNADGGQDLAFVTADGQVWVLWRDVSQGRNLRVSVYPPEGTHGPVNVIGFDGSRCVGAQPVAAGTPGFFCRPSKGPLKLRWQTEPGKQQDRQVIVLKPTRFKLPEQ
jgi:hypothetical protein